MATGQDQSTKSSQHVENLEDIQTSIKNPLGVAVERDEDLKRLHDVLKTKDFIKVKDVVQSYAKRNIRTLDDFFFKEAPPHTVIMLAVEAGLPKDETGNIVMERGERLEDIQNVIQLLSQKGADFLRSLKHASMDNTNSDVVTILLYVFFKNCFQRGISTTTSDLSEEDGRKIEEIATVAATNKQFLKAIKYVYLLQGKLPTDGVDGLNDERKELLLNKTKAEPFFLSFRWLWALSPLRLHVKSVEAPTQALSVESFSLHRYNFKRNANYGAMGSSRDALDGHDGLPSEDVLLETLDLCTQLRKAATCEHHLLSGYRKISDETELFAVALVDEVEDERELAVVMELQDRMVEGEDTLGWTGKNMMKLSLLHIAVEKRCKLFVASRNCQHLLDSVIFGHPNSRFRKWNSRPPGLPKIMLLLLKLIVAFLVVCFMAVGLFLYVPVSLIRYWKVGKFEKLKPLVEFYERPCQKFLADFASYLTFLGLMMYASSEEDFAPKQVVSGLTWPDVLIFVYAVAFSLRLTLRFVLRCQHLWVNPNKRSLRLMFPDAMTIVNVLCMSLIMYTIGSWVQRWRVLGRWVPDDDAFRAADICFSVASILSFLNLFQFLKAQKTLGTLSLSLYLMLTRDVFYFGIIFSIVFFAFGTGVRKMFSYYVSAIRASGTNHTHKLSSYTETFETLFWLLTGTYERKEIDIPDDSYKVMERVGEAMMALYTVCMVLVALNMLIATMNQTYETIMKNVDIEYRFTRTRMWLNYITEDYSALPPPLNVGDVWKLFVECWYKACKEKIRPSNGERKEKEHERIHIIKLLVVRYLYRSLGLEETLHLQDRKFSVTSDDGYQRVEWCSHGNTVV